GAEGAIAIEHEELGIAVAEGVAMSVLGGECVVGEIPVEVGFSVAGDREDGDPAGELIHAEEVFEVPLELMGGLSAVGEVTDVEGEVWAFAPDGFGEAIVDVGTGLGIAENGEGEGGIRK